MKRRAFIALVGSSVAALPFAARAQQSGGIRRVGFSCRLLLTIQNRGRGARVSSRALNGMVGRMAAICASTTDMPGVGPIDSGRSPKSGFLQPDVIFAQSTGVVAAVQRENRTIPVVLRTFSDPVGSGFVASLPRPGSNLTGMLLFDGGLSGKWLSMLKEISPGSGVPC